MTVENISDIVSKIINDEEGTINKIRKSQEALEHAQARSPVATSSAVAEVTPQRATAHGGQLHFWPGGDGIFHKVPNGFRWPSDSAFALWDLWFNGNPSLKICPYRFIESSKDLQPGRCRVNRARTQKVITRLIDIAVDSALIAYPSDITAANSTEIFDCTYPELIQELYGPSKQRSIDVNMYTLANRMYAVSIGQVSTPAGDDSDDDTD